MTKRAHIVSLMLTAGIGAACSNLLDVKNPNNVNASDLNNPAAAPAIANGALATVAYGWGSILLEYSTTSDELSWIGSRDGFRELDVGNLTNPTNEFTDAAFPFIGRARWMSDLAVTQLAGFDAAGSLKSRDDLARSYLYAGLAYTMIGDMFNNFPIASDRRDAAPPLGGANMDSTYKVAIAYATTGISIAQATANRDLERALTALRARAEYAKALWTILRPAAADVPHNGTGLVNDADANADAAAVLGLLPADWRYQFKYSINTIDNYIGAWVNSRQEMRVGDSFIKASTNDTLKDPISGKVDPELRRAAVEFKGTSATQLYQPLTVLSARELHLILAEAALAVDDTVGPTSGFAIHINARRALDKIPDATGQLVPMPAYDPLNPAHPRALAMLKYERKANLFLQGRRIHDLYRFREIADRWQTTIPVAEAVTSPGTFFPITQIELLANPYCVADPNACK